jgi:transcriptional regulator with XRE-family HTH domain
MNTGNKIRMIRDLRGYSQAFVAGKLNIDQTAYSRMENNKTKLDADRIELLAEVLGVSMVDILSLEPTIVNFGPNHTCTQDPGQIENCRACQKDFFERIIKGKNEEIERLEKIVEKLMKQ